MTKYVTPFTITAAESKMRKSILFMSLPAIGSMTIMARFSTLKYRVN